MIEIPKPADLARSHAIDELSKLVKRKIQLFVKVGEEDPMYRLESTGGMAIFPSAEEWFNYGTFRRIVASRFDAVAPVLKPAEWKYYCDMLMLVLEKEEADEETEITGRMLMWLNAYLDQKQVYESWSMLEGRKDRTEPHLGDAEGDRGVFVNSTNLGMWLATKYGEQLTVKELTARFKMIGAKSKCWRGGHWKVSSRHWYWRLPDEHFNLERFEFAPEKTNERKEEETHASARPSDDIV